MNMSFEPVAASPRSPMDGHLRVLAAFALALGVGGMGCFRATGITRPDTAVEEIPATGGDRVNGLKATAGPGDFFLGNDSVQIAVDGAVFGNRPGQFGAPSGGAVLDAGSVALDQSFHRVSAPSDMLERLGPVANQDPDLPLVFDSFVPANTQDQAILDMQGYLLDPKGKLGVPTDAQGRVVGVSVSHRITLANQSNAFFTLETTLTPAAGTTLPVQSIGDYLSQHGGGYRFVIPAISDFSGTALPAFTWGVEIPGTDFTDPLHNSVQAPMVALMGSESAGSTFDYHSSLGIVPLDGPTVLVASDPQDALNEIRPVVPGRLVVGRPVPGSLVSGQAITYRRRLYISGGPSYASNLPAQGTVLFSQMAQDIAALNGATVGFVAYNSFGTAVRGGPLQTEFRAELYTYVDPDPINHPTPFDPTDPSNPASQPQNWLLQRVEWREPGEVNSTNGAVGMLLPIIPNPSTPGVSYPFRLSCRNANEQMAPLYFGTNLLDTTRPQLATPITPTTAVDWQVAEALSPERADVTDTAGNVIRNLQTAHIFTARQAGTLETGGLNPLRMTFLGVNGVADPKVQRIRQLSSTYSPISKAKTVVSANYGAYHYLAGNQLFGTAFGANAASDVMYFPPGEYLVYATRGPLSNLESLPINAFDGQTDINHAFVVFPPTLPSGWTTFDLPAPTQATTGGYNPGEMLSSALAEGVQVIARTEQDVLTDPIALQAEFRAEIDIPQVSDSQRAPIGNDPFVAGARSSMLTGYGFATALFTPQPSTDRNGGAAPSAGWTLADFITQAQGTYNVVHRPRGPSGLFTLQNFVHTVPLAQTTWWNAVGPASLGAHNGDFDALELLQAASCNPADPTAWYAEFATVRDDWFAILDQQTPTHFTKGLGLSAAQYSLDTPVGLARTYLNIGTEATNLLQANLNQVALALQDTTAIPYAAMSAPLMASVLTALQNGAAVASTGPMLDVSVNGVGPGGLVAGPIASVNLVINLYAPSWVPVDEVRVVVNGAAPIQVPLASFMASTADARLRTATVAVPMPAPTTANPAGTDAWLVVEAGVSRTQSGPYMVGTPWNKIMKGIYPIAITNPIFVDVNGGGYTPPGLPPGP